MNTLEIVELSRILQRERLEEAERDRTYRRLRELRKERTQPLPHRRTRRHLVARLVGRRQYGWRIA